MRGTFEQRAGRSKEMSRREMWRKRVPGRRNSRSEGSETGLCAECLRRRIGDSVPGGTRVRKEGWAESLNLAAHRFLTCPWLTDSHKNLELVQMLW